MKSLNTSPTRGNFHIECEMKKVGEGKKTIEEAQEMIDFFMSFREHQSKMELDPKWQKDNMEYDLRSTKWICDKVKESDGYAQNLYAAICNNDFVKNEVWPKLQEKTWSASWRRAGGIIANMREKGDYIDWYCSGIIGGISDEEFHEMNKDEQEHYLYIKNNYVSESVITNEIREDLLKLGWLVLEDKGEI